MDAPDVKTALPGPKAKAIIERDSRVVSPSYTRSYPFVMARGSGATVEDVDGNVFLEAEVPGMELSNLEIYVTGGDQLTIKEATRDD